VWIPKKRERGRTLSFCRVPVYSIELDMYPCVSIVECGMAEGINEMKEFS
jgi:hypothetical protein